MRFVTKALGPCLLPLALVCPTQAATVLFSDNFDSYADGKADTAYLAAYTFPAAVNAFNIASSTGLGGSKSTQNTADSTLVRKDVSANLANGAVTVELYLQWAGTGTAAPAIGLLTTGAGSFTGPGDIGGRLSDATGNKLVIRSNNGNALVDTNTLTLTVGAWYKLSTTITKTATTNELFVLLALYSSDNAGNIGGLVDSISSTVTNSTIWGDSSLFAGIRENTSNVNMDNFSMTQVPEVASVWLLGGAGLLGLRRRR